MAGPTKAELARQLAAVSEQAEREAARARRLFTLRLPAVTSEAPPERGTLTGD